MSKKLYPSIRAAATIAALLMLLLTISCQRKSEGPLIQAKPAFRQYVEAYTSGMVSTRTIVRIRLTEDFVDSTSIGQPIQSGLLDLNPSVKGVLMWADGRTLEFRPDAPFEAGKAYTVQFSLSRLITVPDSLSTMIFQFRTMKQDFDVNIDHHNPQNPPDRSPEMITGMLYTADVASDSAVELMLTATQDGKSLAVAWEHDSRNNSHLFQVRDIVRGDQPSAVKINVSGDPIGASQDREFKEDIAPLGEFKYVGMKPVAGDEPCFSLTFTDPLSREQNFDGAVSCGKMRGLRLSLSGNELFVFPPPEADEEFMLTVEPFLRNSDGRQLGQRLLLRIDPAGNKPAVRFVGSGTIMPSSSGMLLPFEAVNLRAVDIKVVRIFGNNILQFLQTNDMSYSYDLARVGKPVLQKTIPLNGASDYGRWNRYSIDLSTVMKSEPGAIYSVNLSFKKQYSAYPCGGSSQAGKYDMIVVRDLSAYDEKGDWNYYSYSDDDFDETGGWQNYHWQERNDPCKSSYYTNKSASRNVFASDLGLIAKAGEGNNMTVFVTDLLTSKPVKEAEVSLFSYQMQLLGRGSTSGEGMVHLKTGSRPFFVVAQKGDQKGYLRLAEGSSLSLSMFDIGGEPVQKGLKGFIFGERGVWRPGDSVYLTFILEDKSRKLPSNHPVSLSLTNPSGQLVTRQVVNAPLNGFYTFRLATSPSAPTGNWLATVKAGGAEFRKTLKIETVKPNRLKLKIDFNRDYLQKNRIPPLTLQANWLTGPAAGPLKAEVGLTLTRSVTAFKDYPAYTFDNPSAAFAAENVSVFSGKLGADGKATFTPVIHVTNVAPGALNASFETRVFEEGGDFSVDRFTIPYFPYFSYAGLSVPQPSPGERVLYTGKDYDIGLVNVEPSGALVQSNRLKAELFKLEWRWWWDDSERNSADFVSTSHLKPVDSATLRTAGGKASYRLRVSSEEWGRYLLRVTDLSSGHVAGKIIYVDWPGYYRLPGGEKQAASMLTLTTDKSKYKAGETVKISIPTSPDGRALLTVENGSGVLTSFWTPTRKGSTDISFRVTEEMAPNCYAFVTLIQPHAQSVNDLPIRLYGVLPVFVEDPATHLKPVISLKGKLTPLEKASVSVSEAGGKAMTYTLAIVDEGLLDLTRFKTPDPWNSFYAREALGVKTWDLFDQVMGAFSGDLQRILSIGGDQEALNRSGFKANRFRPMVRFFGPFSLKRGETRTTSFTMPEYIGSVRIMVVAGNEGAYGSSEITAPVKKPLMVQGTLPRVLGNGESFTLPVSVFALENGIGNVKVSIEPNDLFEVSGGTARELNFTGTGDQLVEFSLKTGGATGLGKIRIIAAGAKGRAESNIEVDVRNPNFPLTDVYDKAIPPGGSWNASFTPRGVKGTNTGSLELSTLPPFNLEKWISYLIHYPYGCLEQITSSAFPQLYLKDMSDLDQSRSRQAEKNIAEAIRMIRSSQMASGGLAYWPGSAYADDWGTTYAGHFMLEAEKKGYAVPPGFFQAWKGFQREKALSWNVNANWYNNDLSQAYRLYTLALARAPEIGAMNRLLEKQDLLSSAKWRLAAAYLLAGKPEVATQLVNGLGVSVPFYHELSETYGSDLRDKAMILEVMNLMNLKTRAAPLAKDIAAELCSSGWLSTQTASFCLLSLGAYYGTNAGSGIKAGFSFDGKGNTEVNSAKPLSVSSIDPAAGRSLTLSVTNKGSALLYARLVVRGIPAYGDSSSAENGIKLGISYTGLNGKALDPKKLPQGTTFLAVVKVSNPGSRGALKNLALLQVFPSGWEIGNARMSEAAAALTKGSNYASQDVRDDRVITYFDLAAGETRTFKVLLTAAYRGAFRMPSVQCEAMYDNSINARVPGFMAEVTR